MPFPVGPSSRLVLWYQCDLLVVVIFCVVVRL